jgi:16S rRNA (uracil1498-N3)-methyltransferase
MPHNRFFSRAPLLTIGLHELDLQELHHLQVMRITRGDTIELIDGQGALGLGTVNELTKSKCTVSVSEIQRETAPQRKRTLALALLKPAHLEFAIEKAVEVGISSIILFKGDRSEKKELSPQAHERLLHIRRAACKQSGRLYLPSLHFFPSLPAVLENIKKDNYSLYFGDHRATELFRVDTAKNALFCIGAEAGLSTEEKELLTKEGATAVVFSSNTLRAETAAIIASYLLST